MSAKYVTWFMRNSSGSAQLQSASEFRLYETHKLIYISYVCCSVCTGTRSVLSQRIVLADAFSGMLPVPEFSAVR